MNENLVAFNTINLFKMMKRLSKSGTVYWSKFKYLHLQSIIFSKFSYAKYYSVNQDPSNDAHGRNQENNVFPKMEIFSHEVGISLYSQMK